MYFATLLFKAPYIAFIVYVISVLAIAGNQTLDLAVVSAMFELQDVWWSHYLSHGQTRHMYRMMQPPAVAAICARERTTTSLAGICRFNPGHGISTWHQKSRVKLLEMCNNEVSPSYTFPFLTQKPH